MPYLIVFTIGCVFSGLRSRDAFSESKIFYVVGVIVATSSIAWATRTTTFGGAAVTAAYFTVMVTVGSMISWVFFFHGLIVFCFFSVAKEMMGDNRVAENVSFDKAEAAIRRRDFEAAEEFLLEAVARFKAHAEPKLRLAEFYAERDRFEESAEMFRHALKSVKDMEARARFTFRLAEILIKAGNKEEAKTALATFRKQAANTRFAEFAALRLADIDG